MELLSKLERTVAGWLKDVPHLPIGARKWLGENIWWIALVGAILTGIAVIVTASEVFGYIGRYNSPAISYYVSTAFVGWLLVTTSVSLVFMTIQGILLAASVTPLKDKQKKGWVLLFATWLVGVISSVVAAVLTLNAFSIIGSLIFSALWAAIGAYFIFELHGEFAHTEKSAGTKRRASSKKPYVPPAPKA